MGTIIQLDEDMLRRQIAEEVNKAVEAAVRRAVESPYLTTTEASKLLHVSKRTLNAWRYARWIPFVKLGGRILFKRSDLQQFIERQTVRKRETS